MCNNGGGSASSGGEESAGNSYIIWTDASMKQLATRAVEIYPNQSGYGFVVEEKTQEEIDDALANYGDISELPDLLLVKDLYLQKYIREYPSLFADLDGILDGGIYNNAKITNVSLNGIPYGCPCTCEPVALYYNKDFADDNEIDLNVGVTWDEFIEYGRTLKEKDIYLLPPAKLLTEALMRATGSLYYDERGSVSSSGALDVFELIEALSTEELCYPDDTVSCEEIAEKIYNGEIFSVIGGPDWFSRIKALSAENGNVHSFAVSRTPKNSVLMYEADLGGFSWMVVDKSDSKSIQEAIDFLIYMFDQDNSEIRELFTDVLTECDLVPCVSLLQYDLDGLDNECFVDPPVIKFLLEISADVPKVYYGMHTQELTEAMENIVSELFDGEITPSQGESVFDGICADMSETYPPRVVERIEIDREPDKTEYYDTESFDPDGMIVHAYFEDGSDMIVKGYTYSPNSLSYGDTEVTVSYTSGGVTVTACQAVTVLARVLKYITATPRKTFLHGDDIGPSAFDVTAYFNVGPSVNVTAKSVSPEKLTKENKQDITVNYGGKSTVVTVDVYRKLDKIEIITMPQKLSYYKGEHFVKTGLSVHATYTNGEGATIPSGYLEVEQSIVKFKDWQSRTNITVYYTERHVTKEDVLTVYKKTGTESEDCEISQDMSGSGRGAVNLSTGNLRYSFVDFVGNDADMPITVSHIYKPDAGNACCVGNDWRLNLQQEIVKKDGKWEYTDKEGKQYSFDDGYERSNDRSAVRNEKLGLDLFESTEESTEENEVYLVDRSNNTLVFKQINGKYRLISMRMYPSTKTKRIDAYTLDIEYESGRISKAIFGKKTGEERPFVEFVYDGDLLSRLKYTTRSGNDVIAKYCYTGNDLTQIELCHSKVEVEYSRVTQFKYADELNRKIFAVTDLSSKNANGDAKSLLYTFGDSCKVGRFTIGYGTATAERDTTVLSYSAHAIDAGTSTDIVLSTTVENNGTVAVYSFNSFGVVSQYGYEIENNSYAKPKKIIGAQSCGFDYKSLSETYSDTLDVYHDDFETDNCGWFGTIVGSHAVYGARSILGTNLQKEYTLSSDVFGEPKSVYLSLWVLGDNATVRVDISGDAEAGTIEHKIDGKLSNKWQFVALYLGKRKRNDKIKVTVEGYNVYIDDVRLTRLPYETPEDIKDTTYDGFGNVTKAYRYNPVGECVECTEYTYNADHRLVKQKTFDTSVKSVIENVYDETGLPIQRKTYGSDADYLLEQNKYDDTDHVLTSSTDADNVVTQYNYGTDYETVTVVGEPNSPDITQKYEYFGNSGAVKNIVSGQLQNGFEYLTDGSLDKVKFNHADSAYVGEYAFEYDTFGNMQALKIGSTSLVSLEYDYKHLNKETCANGATVEYTYDAKDRVVGINENGNAFVTIDHSDNANDLITVEHADGPTYTSQAINKNGITGEYKVVYPDSNGILKVVGYAANNKGNISTTRYFADNGETPFETCVCTNDEFGRLIGIERTGHGASVYYSYDSLHNLKRKETVYATNNKYAVDYEYNGIDVNNVHRKGTRIVKEQFFVGSVNKGNVGYEYYKNGNISKIKDNDEVKAEYVYDEHDRLVWEYNYALSRAYKYSYDNGGNIVKRETYIISDGNVASTPVKTDNYDYDTVVSESGQNSAWHDQLKSYNGTAITYDASGNPLNYLGKAMAWQGRKLTSVDGVAMLYDYNGLRVKKGNRTYYWQGNKLITERWKSGSTDNYIYYYYDESGICGMCYNGNEYYYRKNIFGDVTEIYNDLGELQCRYVYDAWGNCKVYDASGAEITSETNNIGNINPIRYRGYYYDAEIALYYLQSRYYDPNIGRFISPDSVEYLNPETVGGLNLYSYCDNNPVKYADPDGTLFISLMVGFAISFIVGSAASAISQGVQYGWDNINCGQVIIDGLFATASAALAATGVGIGFSIGAGALLGVGQYVTDSAFHQEKLTVGGFLLSAGLGAISGAISGAGAKNIGKIANNLSGRAESGVKAIITATQKYGANSKQVAMVRNLYQGAINKATSDFVNKAFTISIIKIAGTTAGTTILNQLFS